MTVLGKSVLDIDKLLKKKETERETLDDTRFLKKDESFYDSYNSNQTNFDDQSQSSRKRKEITSIMNNIPITSSGISNRNNFSQNEEITNEELNSFDDRKMPGTVRQYFKNVNRSCMNLKKMYPNLYSNEIDSSSKNFNKKKNMLTNSMIVSNYIGTPNKTQDLRDSISMAIAPKMSIQSNKSMRFQRSSMNKSLDNSFQISKKNLSPIQIPVDSFLKVNLSKIPSDTGNFKKKKMIVQECRLKN